MALGEPGIDGGRPAPRRATAPGRGLGASTVSEGVVQRRRLHRLGEHPPSMLGLRARAPPTEDRMSTGVGCAASGRRADRLGQRDAVQLRHEEVEQRDVELARRRGPRRAPRSATRCRDVVIAQRSSCAARIRRLVALSSTTRTRRPARSDAGARRVRGTAMPAPSSSRIDQVERRALARHAALSASSEPSIASARRRLIARPRPRAAVAAARSMRRLAERLEQPVHPVGGDADARVADVDRRSPSGRSVPPRPRSMSRPPEPRRRPRRAR